ncbi:glycosyltransferase [Chloroflexota bacterium]
MRILEVTSCFYPAWAYGGPVAVAFYLSKEMVKRGHEVVVYTTDTIDRDTRQRAKYLEIEGIKVYYFRNISNKLASRNLFFAPSMLPQLKNKIRHFDIVHLQDYRSFQNIVVHYYAKKYVIPYVVQAGGSATTQFGKVTLKKIFDKVWGHRILKDASRLIALTRVEAEQYENMGIGKNKIEIVPNAIDLSEFENLPQRGIFKRKHNLNGRDKVVLYLGRINKIKGIDLLVKSFAKLPKDFNDVKLAIVGPDDGYLPALKKLIKELNIEEKTLVTGPLYERDKLETYVDADVYVLPSVYEAFGITVLEACACGTPVIVTDRCGLADFVDKVGYVVEYDEDRLRDVLIKLLNDRDLSRKLGDKGKRLVAKEFGWNMIVKKVENLYKCAQNRGPEDV